MWDRNQTYQQNKNDCKKLHAYTHTLIHNKNESIKVPTEIHIIEGQHKTIDKVFALSDLISNLFSL